MSYFGECSESFSDEWKEWMPSICRARGRKVDGLSITIANHKTLVNWVLLCCSKVKEKTIGFHYKIIILT